MKSLLKRCEQNPKTFKAYDQLIKDHSVNNMIEKCSENQSENAKEFLLPHRPVIRRKTESTKLRVVYDSLAKSGSGYSLNDGLLKETSLQNKLSGIIIRTRFRPVIWCANIENTFLQIHI